jgi:LPS sulfotransferase NodH
LTDSAALHPPGARAEQPQAKRIIRFPELGRNGHLEKIEEILGPIVRKPAHLPAGLSFVFLCFTNRCGSNFLAELLASTGHHNRAGEILNWPVVQELAQRRKFAGFQDFFRHVATHQQKNGRYFIKTALAHLEILARAGILRQVFDRSQFVLIERNDKLAQAISHTIAFATGGFTSEQETVVKPHQLEYSLRDIDRRLTAITASYSNFAIFFGRNGIVPARIIYERLVAEPDGEVAWLARELGLPDLPIDHTRLRLERQSGPINEEWRRRYLAERD